VDAGRQYGDRRRTLAGGRRNGRERAAQVMRIGFHRPDAVLHEQLREHLHHRLAVLDHVRDAGRGAGIVLQHVELVLADAHDVGADDVGVDPARRREADHFRQEGDIALDQPGRDLAGLHDLLVVVNVVQEHVQRTHPLLDALGQALPFPVVDDPRHEVERDQPLGRLRLAIDGESDAGAPEEALGLAGLLDQQFGVLLAVPGMETLVGLAHTRLAYQHLVKRLHGVPPDKSA
jgi:hypothetical protein